MRTRQTMTISLPPAMVSAVEKVCKTEHRTRSELIREALRVYFARIQSLPVYTPTRRELRAIEQGREEMRRGQVLTLDELFRNLAGPRGKARAKSHRARS